MVIRFCRALNFEFLSVGAGGTKNTQKTKNSDIEVQSFGHNSKTNQDIKIRNSNLTSPMNYEVKDIKMTLNLFDLDLHRIAHLSNIQNFAFDTKLHV